VRCFVAEQAGEDLVGVLAGGGDGAGAAGSGGHFHRQTANKYFAGQCVALHTDIMRMSCSYQQCVTIFTEELPLLKVRDLELVTGEAICAWLGWRRPSQPVS
jgi:hypothetical protein